MVDVHDDTGHGVRVVDPVQCWDDYVIAVVKDDVILTEERFDVSRLRLVILLPRPCHLTIVVPAVKSWGASDKRVSIRRDAPLLRCPRHIAHRPYAVPVRVPDNLGEKLELLLDNLAQRIFRDLHLVISGQ